MDSCLFYTESPLWGSLGKSAGLPGFADGLRQHVGEVIFILSSIADNPRNIRDRG